MARLGFGKERHDVPGSAVDKDSERPYTAHFKYAVLQGSNLATAYKKGKQR